MTGTAPAIAVTLVLAIAVGAAIGASGVGGVLLVPLFVLVGGLPIHSAAATAILTGSLVSLFAFWTFWRAGEVPPRIALLTAAGGLLGSYPGARFATSVPADLLTLLIAGIVAFAGVSAARGPHAGTRDAMRVDVEPRAPAEAFVVFVIGALAGFGAGLSGAGGPVFAIPILLALGYRPLGVVASSGLLVLAAGASGGVAYARAGLIDYQLALAAAGALAIGARVGIAQARRLPPAVLRRLVALMCICCAMAMVLLRVASR